MKLVFRLGFLLIPVLFFLSQTAYPRGFSRGHRGVTDLGFLGPTAGIPITFSSAPVNKASRSPASVGTSVAAARPSTRWKTIHFGECSALADLGTLSASQGSHSWETISENIHENAVPAVPHEGSGIGAQAAVLHFGE